MKIGNWLATTGYKTFNVTENVAGVGVWKLGLHDQMDSLGHPSLAHDVVKGAAWYHGLAAVGTLANSASNPGHETKLGPQALSEMLKCGGCAAFASGNHPILGGTLYGSGMFVSVVTNFLDD